MAEHRRNLGDEARQAQLDPRLVAAVDVLRRTGLREFQLRYDDDPAPVVWIALGQWRAQPARRGGYVETVWETASAMHPLHAALRLCERVLDGGLCTHCGRMTGFDADRDPQAMPGPDEVGMDLCWWQWHEGQQAFVRACAGAG